MDKKNNLVTQRGAIVAPGRILEFNNFDDKDSYKITILAEIPIETRTSSDKIIQVVEDVILPANEIEQYVLENWMNIKVTAEVGCLLSQNGFYFELRSVKFHSIGVPNEKALEILEIDNLMKYFNYTEDIAYLIQTSLLNGTTNNTDVLKFYRINEKMISILEIIQSRDFFDEEFCNNIFDSLQCLNTEISIFVKQLEPSNYLKEILTNQLRGILSLQLGVFKLKDQIEENSK